MSVIPVIGPVIELVLKVIKKKKFVLWYLGRDGKWIKKGGPFSKRQCRLTQAALVQLGTYIDDRFCILREGVTP
jgi:hypothetical protein